MNATQSKLALLNPSPHKFLVFGKPDISQDEIYAVNDVLDSGWLSTGPIAKRFEQSFAEHLGVDHAVAVSSCTEALILAMLAAGIGPGQEVILPPMTFCATLNAVLQVGARPVFVDVTSSGHIDPEKVEKAICDQTRAVIAVHYTGSSCDMQRLDKICKARGLYLIEDAAHGFGGFCGNKKLGTLGDFGCFSFYPTKNITSGEGGMVVAKEAHCIDKIRVLSMQGLSLESWKRYGSGPVRQYQVEQIGRKGNMSDIHAAIGMAQLHRWPEMRKKRLAVWSVYSDAFGEKPEGHSMHLYTIEHAQRDSLRDYLHAHGIGTGVHFNPLHLEPAYGFLRGRDGKFPEAERIGARTVSLPVSSTMTVADAKRVVRAVKEFDR